MYYRTRSNQYCSKMSPILGQRIRWTLCICMLVSMDRNLADIHTYRGLALRSRLLWCSPVTASPFPCSSKNRVLRCLLCAQSIFKTAELDRPVICAARLHMTLHSPFSEQTCIVARTPRIKGLSTSTVAARSRRITPVSQPLVPVLALLLLSHSLSHPHLAPQYLQSR